MRIIAGSAKGTRLVTPKGGNIRPTLDRVREALFSILAPRLPSARFLDLFAGTGANGLEALSRGAAQTTFVDRERRALAIIEKNLQLARLSGGLCLQLNLPQDLPRIAGRFDIVFADPPYDFPAYTELVRGVEEAKLLAKDGLLVLEHGRKSVLPEQSGELTRRRITEYGDTRLSFYA